MNHFASTNEAQSARQAGFPVCPHFNGTRMDGAKLLASERIWNTVMIGLIALLLNAPWAGAVIYQGTITNWQDSSTVRRIGAEGQFVDLYWSIATDQGTNSTGWFYGSQFTYYADVAHAAGITNVSQITNAAIFPFQALSAGPFGSGTFLIWRNKFSGHFGVLRVDSISNLTLIGTWWFQADGSGNFNSTTVPAPAASSGVVAVIPATQLVLESFPVSQRRYEVQSGSTPGSWTNTNFMANSFDYHTRLAISRRDRTQAYYRLLATNTGANPSANIDFNDYPQPNPVGGTNRISLTFRYREALRNPFQSVSIADVSLQDAKMLFYKNLGSSFFTCIGLAPACSPVSVASSFADGTWIKLSWEVVNVGGQFSVLNGRAVIETYGTNDFPSATGVVLLDLPAYPVTNVGYSQSPTIIASFRVQEWGGVDLQTVTVQINNFNLDSLLAPRLTITNAVEVIWTPGMAGDYYLEYRPEPTNNSWFPIDWSLGGSLTNFTLFSVPTTDPARFRVTPP